MAPTACQNLPLVQLRKNIENILTCFHDVDPNDKKQNTLKYEEDGLSLA